MTISTLLRFNLRYYRRHFLISLLCLMGISLGVGIVVAVELINDSALSSFGSSVDFLSGRATHSVVSAYGRIEERLFSDIWRDPAVKAASPVIEAFAVALETGGEPIRFLGLDPFLDGDFRNLAAEAGGEAELMRFLAGPEPAAYVSENLVKRFGPAAGRSLTVLVAGMEKPIRILGALPGGGSPGLGENIVVMDISAAQEVFGRKGYVDRIDVIDTGAAGDLQSRLPSGLRLTDANSRKATLEAMLYSFQLNLAAMSLLALFVGIFLIYNFSMFSVLSRRENMSLLLTLGADRSGLVAAFLAESLLLGAAGSILGIAFGYAVAWWSMEKVGSTITELYFYVNVDTVRLTRPIVLSGIAVGFVATLVGTILPALEVAVTPPVLGMKRQSIEDRARGVTGLLLAAGALCFAFGLVAAWASRFSIIWGFASAFAMTIAFALFTPSLLSPFAHYAGTELRKVFGSLEAFLAARMVRASLSRTSVAVAALAVALSMTIGVDGMIGSFRQSVAAWLDGSLQGDIYISPATTKWDHPLPDELIDELRKRPDVEAVERYSTHEVFVQEKPARLRIVDAAVLKNHAQFRFLDAGSSPWEDVERGGVFVSESLAYRFSLERGQELSLDTPKGRRSFPVAAVVRDYSSDQGTIQMDRIVYEKLWNDSRVQSVALFLVPGTSVEDVRRSIVKEFPGLDRTIASNTKMREDILVIFDRTFAPTATLKGVSLLVALLGVATALMAILLERSREMTVLGYLGLTPKETARMNVHQALVMGVTAFLIASVCGVILTYVIIHAINYRSFGWSVDVHLDPWVFARTFGFTMAACLASALYPSYRLLKARSGLALHEE